MEPKNKENQRILDSDINHNKAEVWADKFNRFYPELICTFIPQYITSAYYLEDMIFKDCVVNRFNPIIPIIVGCVDNNATRKLLHEVFLSEDLRDVIYIDAGNGTTNRSGQVIVGYRIFERFKMDKPNIVLKPVCSVFPEILRDKDDIENVVHCNINNEEAPQNIATNVMSAATIFAILNNIIAYGEINTHQHFFSVNTEAVEIISKKVE